MKSVINIKLANGEKTISTKIHLFNFKLGEVRELKDKLEISSGNKELDRKYEASYYTKLYELNILFQEIEEDNLIYFSGTLNFLVQTLKDKIDLL